MSWFTRAFTGTCGCLAAALVAVGAALVLVLLVLPVWLGSR